jgi:hypothetical protein
MLVILLESAICSTGLVELVGNWSITATRVNPSGEKYEPSDTFLLNLNSSEKSTVTGALVNIGRSLDYFATVTLTYAWSKTPNFNITIHPKLDTLSGTLDFREGPNAVGNVNGSPFSVRIVGGAEIEVTVVKGKDTLTVYRAQNLSTRAPQVVVRILHVWAAVVVFTVGVMIVRARKSEDQNQPAPKAKTD